MSTASAAVEGLASPAVATESPRFVRRLLGRKLAIVCLTYIAVVVAIAAVAPLALPGIATQHAGNLLIPHQGPSWDHLLGTDTLGRDVFDRLLVGTRVTMVGVAEALVVVLLLGVPLGLAAGYFGGRTDRAVMWVADLAFAMPAIIIILVVLSVFPQSMFAGMVTFGLLAAPGMMRIVRSATLPVKEELYISAARVSGLSRPYIVGFHVLPRVTGPIIVQTALIAATALLVQTGLAFLSLLVGAPAPSWGGMVADGVSVLNLQPWLIVPPGLAIAMTILALGLLGDAVRDTNAETWAGPVTRRRRARRPTPPSAEDQTEEAHTNTAGALLAIKGLSISFTSPSGNNVRVVQNVSFDIRPGEAVGVVGESGCGKSATAMSILNLLPGTGRIETGRILFEGRDLAVLSERELGRVRGKEIGLVSQEPMISLNPAFRVGWQLSEAVRRHRRVSRRDAHAQVLELLKRVQFSDPEAVARRYPHELSGGMAQRVVIARALAGEPKLLIADEPTTALDVTVQAEILDLLHRLREDSEMAIMLVTHDWGVIADLCDRVVVMYAGEVVERADLVSLFEEPLHPYTKALLASSPSHTDDVDHRLSSIPGAVPRPGQWPAGCHFHPRCSYSTSACREQRISMVAVGASRETRCIHYKQLIAGR